MAAPNVKYSSDDAIILVNGIPVGHYIEGTCQPDTGSRITPIETAEGIVGQNVGPAARGRPGSGSFSFRITSPDSVRLAEHSANGDEVSVTIRIIKNFSAYAFKEIGLTSAWLGPVPIGPAAEARSIEVSFSGTGYYTRT